MSTNTALKPVKARIKGALKSARRRYAQAFRSFSASDLEHALRELGLAAGDTVLVHSAFDAFEGFTGKPTDAIGALQRVVSEQGTLLMPTLPFGGTAVAYAESDPLFDPARTPSRMGLLTELFRRLPGVVRSVHPTHSVAVWGRDADAIAADHWHARTPCGAGTPYARLLEHSGKILLLGADVSSLTFYHTVEELLESSFPVSPFTAATYRLRSRLQDGLTVETQTRLFEPLVSKRRNLYRLVPELKARNAWHEARLGRLNIVLLAASDVLECVRCMIEKRVFCYD